MLLAGLLIGVTVGAVTQNDLIGLRSDIQRLGGQIGQLVKDVGDIKSWQSAFNVRQEYNDDRFKELRDDQAAFVANCRSNHAVQAVPLRIAAADEGASKSQIMLGLTAFVTILVTLGHYIIVGVDWVKHYLVTHFQSK